MLRQRDDVDVVFVARLRDGEVRRRGAAGACESDDGVMMRSGGERGRLRRLQRHWDVGRHMRLRRWNRRYEPEQKKIVV